LVRAGAHALTLLSAPLNVQVLKALEDGPMSLMALKRAAGSPPQSTMRKQLRTLVSLGIVERRQEPGFGCSVDYRLGSPGIELLDVARVAQAWLGSAPDGPLELGTFAAKNSIKALVDGWSSTVVRALAGRPVSLTQLSRLISTINSPSLERRLAAMRITGQVVSCETREGRSRPYAATPWLRRAIAPILSAARWERQFAAEEASPIAQIDIESSFLLTVPTLQLPGDLRGTARLAVELRRSDGTTRHAGVMAQVERGSVTSCSSRLEASADAWISGTVGGWLSAAVQGDFDDLEIGGDGELAHSLTEALHEAFSGMAHAASA
jgi:DNA-binding HxlR family transcriptional regulator